MFQSLRRGRCRHRPGRTICLYGNLRRIRTALGSMWASTPTQIWGHSALPRKIGARMRIIPMCSINITLNLSKQRIRRWRRPDAPVLPTSQKIGRPLVPSQQAPGFLWQDSRRGSVSGLNCRRKERHLLQSPPSPIKTANTNKKSAQPNPLAARIHSLPLREIHVRPRFRRRYGTALSRPDLAQRASQ